MFLGEIIKKYREEHNLSLRAFASKCGLSYTYISMLEKNVDYRTGKPIAPTLESVKYISNAMGISIDNLLKILDDEQEFKMNEETPKYNSMIDKKQVFPLLGTVRAGYNYLAQENWIGYVNLDKEVSDPENYFALKVTGDSMQPIMYEDDIVIVHKQNDVESGQVAIVIVDGEEATVKKLIKYENHIELVAFNSYYPPKKLTKKDDFKIIGKVIEARISKIFE